MSEKKRYRVVVDKRQIEANKLVFWRVLDDLGEPKPFILEELFYDEDSAKAVAANFNETWERAVEERKKATGE